MPALPSLRPALLLLLPLLALPVLAADDDKKKDEDEKKEKTYADIVPADAETDDGLIRVHRVEGKLLFEIPEDLLGRDLLLVSRIARVPADLSGGFIAAGHKANEQVVRWEKQDDRLLLRRVSYRNVADPEEPIYRSVVNNNFTPILAAFDIAIEGPDPGDSTAAGTRTFVADVTSLFVDDVPAIGPLDKDQRKSLEVKSLDKDRSFLNHARSYPENVEVRHTLTFKATDLPHDADTETLTLEMNQSMVLLPAEPMRVRYADDRVGWFTVERTNFGLPAQKAGEEEFLRRWRLEPSDPAAYARGELVEPVKPIVWYLDPATPEEWKPFVRQGVEDWNMAFESAGFRNAVRCLDPPSPEEDPEWNGEDIRYSVVRWAANRMRNAMGPSVSDPRSGEILESDIVWYHNHMRSYRNRLMIETGAANPLARSLPIDAALMGEAMRQVIAHEVGHALGLPHNMIASAAYPVDSLRSVTFVRRWGLTPSIMEYARQNYVAQPGDGMEGPDFIRKIGPYDHYAIEWGYRVLPDIADPRDEKPVLDGWILAHAGDPVYRFGPQRGGLPVDPRIQTEDLGDDPVKATGYGIANLKRVAPNLIAWTTRPGENYDDLRELHGELTWRFTAYLRHVVSVVGGVSQDLKTSDQPGPVYTPVPADRQREAVAFLAEHAFVTPDWLLDPEILSRIEYAGAVERVRALQERLVEDLLDAERFQRMTEIADRGRGDAYTPDDLLTDLEAAIFPAGDPDAAGRALQRAYVDRLIWMLDAEPQPSTSSWAWRTAVDGPTSDMRAVARGHLADLRFLSGSRGGSDTAGLHFEELGARIAAALDD